jgi:hypothetical protein
MFRPGTKSLGEFTITTAGEQVSTWVANQEGVLAILAQLRFMFGGGAGTVKAYLQTSADGGTTAIDIASFTFAGASAVKARNLSALTPRTTDVTPTDGALADDTSVDGMLGDRFRLKVVSTGTYSGSTQLSGRLVAR